MAAARILQLNILHLTLSYVQRRLAPNDRESNRRLGELRAALPPMAVLVAEPGPHCERFRTVHCLGRTSRFDRRVIGRIYKLCQEERIDIIHTHDAASQAAAALLRLRCIRAQSHRQYPRPLLVNKQRVEYKS